MSGDSSRNVVPEIVKNVVQRIGRPKRDSKQKTLDHYRVRRPRVDLNEDVVDIQGNVVDGNMSQEANVSDVEAIKKKESERSFLSHWSLKHKWAYPIFGSDGKQRAKCIWYSEFGLKTPFAREGSSTMGIQALDKHANSDAHKIATQLWALKSHRDVMPIQKHVELMVDAEKQRIITVMQIMYFIVVKDMPLNFYYAQCEFMRYMRTPNMPVSNEYSTYTNRTSGMEFIQAAKEFYWESLKLSICKSPFFAILIDDSTDLTFEKHMIVYVTYLEDEGRGPPVCKFVALLPLADGKAQTKFDELIALIQRMGLGLEKWIGFASDGASCMRGVNNGVLAKIRQKVPNIIGVHCIAHLYAWVGRSVQRHKELEKLLRGFILKPLEVLRIHSVRWLSRGKVMKRLVTMMPALLHDFKENDVNLYTIARTFQVQFLVHFMADVLVEMNAINKKFQDDHVDITEVGNALDVVIELFKKRYLGDTFGYGCKHFREFMRRLNANNELVYVKENGYVETHMLHFTSFSQNLTSGNSVSGCIALAKSFVQELIAGIDARFNDLPLYNAAKLYSTTSFDKDVAIRGQTHKVYLDRLCAKFGSSQNGLVDAFLCEVEVDRFCLQLYKTNSSFGFHDAWSHCCDQISWIESFPNLMKMWQALLVIPVSTAACEHGFSKQNRIKDDERSSLTLKTLEMLMFLSLSAPHDLDKVEWDAIYEIWANMKFRRVRHVDT
ncbi:hypothetical protein L7F22_054558 [Adiantum nelumboides]|nr:hypothetical protein [Adiantum nelumboides]